MGRGTGGFWNYLQHLVLLQRNGINEPWSSLDHTRLRLWTVRQQEAIRLHGEPRWRVETTKQDDETNVKWRRRGTISSQARAKATRRAALQVWWPCQVCTHAAWRWLEPALRKVLTQEDGHARFATRYLKHNPRVWWQPSAGLHCTKYLLQSCNRITSWPKSNGNLTLVNKFNTSGLLLDTSTHVASIMTMTWACAVKYSCTQEVRRIPEEWLVRRILRSL